MNLQFPSRQFLAPGLIDRGIDNSSLLGSNELSGTVDGHAFHLLASSRSANASGLGADGQIHLDVLAVVLLTSLVSAIVLRSMSHK